jgi:hypothetical protein
VRRGMVGTEYSRKPLWPPDRVEGWQFIAYVL